MVDYVPQAPPVESDPNLSRYTFDELRRIAEALESVSGANYFTEQRVNKFGYAADIDTGQFMDVWDGRSATVKSNRWPILSTPETYDIASSSTSDTNSAGNGLRKIDVYGLTAWDGTEVSERVNMNGTTAVTTTQTFVAIYRMICVDWGVFAAPVGEITATASTAGTIGAYVIPTPVANQTLMACYALAEGQTAYVTKWYASIVAPTSARVATVRLQVSPDPENIAAFNVKSVIGLDTAGTSYMERNFEPWLVVTGPALIKCDAEPGANNTEISAGFDLILR